VGVLQRFERRLGGLVEGAFARVFKGGVEPVELAGALTRECDERRARGARRTLVPNEFVITLSEADFERLSPYRQALCDELATLVREHAAAQRYTFVAPVAVSLELDQMLSVGRYEVRSGVVGGDAPPAAHLAPVAKPGPTQVAGPPAEQPFQGAPAGPDASEASRPTNPAGSGPLLPRLIVTTGGSAEPGSLAAAGQELEVELNRSVTVIGRGSDVDVQLSDTGVSRRHAELLLQRNGQHLYRDLASTNGSRINGQKVREAPLVDGDRIEVGRSVLVYRHPIPPRPGGGRSGGELSGHPAEA
jgi:pSer/pThr/pTyr-binding forkhead associated (FHA) protein